MKHVKLKLAEEFESVLILLSFENRGRRKKANNFITHYIIHDGVAKSYSQEPRYQRSYQRADWIEHACQRENRE